MSVISLEIAELSKRLSTSNTPLDAKTVAEYLSYFRPYHRGYPREASEHLTIIPYFGKIAVKCILCNHESGTGLGISHRGDCIYWKEPECDGDDASSDEY